MKSSSSHKILSAAQMQQADRHAIGSGIASYTLMQNAGGAVADIVTQRFPQQKLLVLAGSGNNGGDGYIIAQKLLEQKWDVTVAALSAPSTEDAKRAASNYKGKTIAATASLFDEYPLVLDAIFGTGLTRAIEGAEKSLIEALNDQAKTVIAVDIPSGINADTGQVMGAAVRADLTVALARKKRGQVLIPGSAYAGEVLIVEIGIPDSSIDPASSPLYENHPDLWQHIFPYPRMEAHKYDRGHTLVVGGDAEHSGAARLAARAALRIGSGLVTTACPNESLAVYAASQMAVMSRIAETPEALTLLLNDVRFNAVVIGPGNGVGERTRQNILAVLKAKRHTVLDADALSVFADAPQTLFTAIQSPCVLTPHEGEFARLFKDIDQRAGKIERAIQAAKQSSTVVLLKGSDTVIADPDGTAVVNTNAPPELATAGSGDVLAGCIAGLMAQGMPPFAAACCAAWLQGEAASLIGPGLISEDLTEALPQILHRLRYLT